jgi:hypothetical protein
LFQLAQKFFIVVLESNQRRPNARLNT